jgi:hypothetical protein
MYPFHPPLSNSCEPRACWLSLFGRLGEFLSGKARLVEQRVADRVKDALFDLGQDVEEDGCEGTEALPLPPMGTKQFVKAMLSPVKIALLQAAKRLNEGPGGYTPEEIEKDVHGIFAELAGQAIEEAFQQRKALAETDLPPVKAGGDWARKYRRMMARDGRWPVPPGSTGSAE